MSATDGQLNVDVRLGDTELADEIQTWLHEQGAQNIKRSEEHGFFPLIPIVIVAVIASGGLATLVAFIRSKTQCQIVLDARGDTIHKEIDCRIRDGRLIILTKDDQKVEVVEAPAILDLTEITSAALTSTADAVKKAALAAGAKAVITSLPQTA